MAWVKIPKENHPLFLAALPKDPRIVTLAMFGGIAALVKGNMFGGLFGRSALAKLGDADYTEALKLDGSEPFDPMGRGHVMSNTVLLGESVMDDPAELREWMHKALTYALTLPAKKKKTAAKPKQKPAPKAKAAKKPAKRRR